MTRFGKHRRLSQQSVAVFAVALLVTAFAPYARAESAAETCLEVNKDFSFGLKLPRTAAILKAKKPLKIVAIGSSSTVGLWMSDPAKTYPGVMKAELLRLVPSAQLDIVNSGRSGDTISGNIARFAADVFSHDPDLVIWQMGGNDFTWGRSGESLQTKIAEGVNAIRSHGADVILMDQQYTPMILASSYAKMQAAIAKEAQQDKVALLPRFEMLHKTIDAGVSIGALSAFDGLHMSGEAYDCIGRALARAIATAVK
jgi:lysophospholipase L1-like esterase